MPDFDTLFTSYIDQCIEEKLIQKYFINKQNVNLVEIQNGYERIRQNLQEIGDIINELYDNHLFSTNDHLSKTATNANHTDTLNTANHSYNQLRVPFLYSSSSSSSSSSTSPLASASSLSSVLPMVNLRKDNILINDAIGTDYLDHVYINLTNLNSLNESSNHVIKVTDPVYVCDKENLTSTIWKPAIVEFIGKDSDTLFYIVKLNGHSVRLESTKIAFNSVPLPHLKIGTNVIARCKINSSLASEDLPLIAGIVAEPPKASNGYRYLVFFNSPLCTCNYVNLDEIHLIVQSNAKPWMDFDESSRGFIKHYISNYPERLMLKINPNEKIKVKIDQFWTVCRVLKVDSSIMKVASIVNDKYSEWIYRGSHRLWPIYHEMFHQVKESSSHNKNRAVRKIIDPRWFNKTTETQPFVQYLQESDSDLELASNSLLLKSKRNQIARKSTAKPSFQSSIHNNHKLKEKSFKFRISAKPNVLRATKSFFNHTCCRQCSASTNQDLAKLKDQNPYTIPIMLGWQRQISVMKAQEEFKTEDTRQVIFYVAPCGRRLRNLEEVDHFLEITHSLLTIDYFVFDVNFELYHHHHQDTISCYYYEPDISKGRENMPISVVNTIDEDVIENTFCYRAKRFGGREVSIPLDDSFLVSCKCDNNCRDSSTCDCRQLTISSTQIIPGQLRDESAGYEHKRLKDFLITGIYECNAKCSCGPSCCNRVVQQGIKVRLQIFKTLRRGWGVRTLHDIPKGAFLTIYAAEILTDSIATQDGHLHGDEYLADLDYIDVCENLKENYEAAPQEELSSDEEEEEESEPEPSSKYDEDKEYRVHRSKLGKSHLSNCWRKSPRIQSKQENKASKPKEAFKSIREYYNECFSYTLDAKRAGNIGRYLNHSCSPNCFVQNVFVDTHDLRFPWVAFFAAKHIPAFSELTWDYNYEIGSVEGKKMLCYCMSLKCRGRLL